MTLSTMLYNYVANEDEDADTYMSVNDFRKMCESNELELEHPEPDCKANIIEQTVKEQTDPVCIPEGKFAKQKANIIEQTVKEHPEQIDPTYIRWQMFDEIPERFYTIQCDGYVDMNGKPLTNEASIKHLTSGEHVDIDAELEIYDKYGNVIDYMDYDDYYSMDHSKYDLSITTKQIRTKKFICEAPIGSGKSTAIRKWIFSHATERFMIIIPTVNIAEEFYIKLGNMNRELRMRLCVNDNAFREFHKAVHAGVNVIITTYNTASKCLGDLIEEYYMSK